MTDNTGAVAQAAHPERWFTSFAFTMAAVLIGYALQISDGLLHGLALLVLTVALAACVAGIAVPTIPIFERNGKRIMFGAAGAGLAFQLWAIVLKFPRPPGMQMYWIYLGGILATMAIAALIMQRLRPQIWLVLLATAHFALGVWTIHLSPDPLIDVFYMQQEACRAIVHGENPYTTTYPDLSGPEGARSSGFV